jgi:hypothetical protein
MEFFTHSHSPQGGEYRIGMVSLQPLFRIFIFGWLKVHLVYPPKFDCSLRRFSLAAFVQ